MAEINENIEYQQDEENRLAYATASLAKLTYNMNRSEKTPALDKLDEFLPNRERYATKKQLVQLQGVSRQAARDYVRYYSELSVRDIVSFQEWDVGLRYLAKS